MKKALEKKVNELYFYKDGVKHIINLSDKSTYPENIKVEINSELRGDISGLRGDISGLRGDISGLWGNVSGLRGDVSGVFGDATNVKGNLDECKLTDEERKKGVDIKELIKN